MKKCESVAQESRAAPSGDEDVRKCRPREPCCTLGRRKSAKVSLKRAVLHSWATISVVFVAEGFPSSIRHSALRPWATKMYESVAQACRAAPSGDEDVRKCRPSVPCCTLGRRKSAKVLPKRAVLHSWATISVVFVAEGFPSSIRHSALRPWATERRGRVALLCRASPSGAGQSGVIVPGELGAAPCSCRWRGSGGRSHGRAAIISAIISGIFV